ncbi:LPXTG cell wall anchor domain-containing protein [Mesobacillus maritimus]|uniref:LPXTG cell wall anchor domain-containing protein n=1 Tax=Mesobacillus maritimus TaxID=1643336 RepID=UPI002041C12B|nr:LPXTG cell wall anchor domain-containing protein [Mesobacillus maritimus]MCM3585497.1 LPXTG cell wall anchor domain-containing protein [Mesobacillus maritimus]
MKYKRLIGLSFIVYVITTIIILFPINIIAATSDVKEIDITTTPEKVLFEVSNMVPGDQATRALTISNSGKQDLNYLFSSRKTSGSDELYRAMQLTVSDEGGEIYKGNMEDFNRLDARNLVSKESEDLILTIEFPDHLGNEYQGLQCVFEFKLYVEGTMGGVLPVDGPRLPNTGTNTFNLIVAGIVIIAGGFTLYGLLTRKKRDVRIT